jgi:hypothetical protein
MDNKKMGKKNLQEEMLMRYVIRKQPFRGFARDGFEFKNKEGRLK